MLAFGLNRFFAELVDKAVGTDHAFQKHVWAQDYAVGVLFLLVAVVLSEVFNLVGKFVGRKLNEFLLVLF